MNRNGLSRRKRTGFSLEMVAAIMERDGHSCFRCGGALHGERGVDYSIQHRRARGMGGTSRPDTNAIQNGIALCGSATTGCHGHVEQNRVEARDNGWAIPQHADPLLVPANHWLDGFVYLHASGSTGSRPIGSVTKHEEASA